MLGEVYALNSSVYDPAKSYFYFELHYSQKGYSLGWKYEHEVSGAYCGSVGDFRNESMVSDLVDQLGFKKCKALDASARQ